MTEENLEKKDEKSKKRYRDTGRDYPYVSLDEAIKVIEAINNLGGYASKQEIGESLKKKGGWLGGLIVSTKRYGLIEGHGKFNLSEISKKILSPTYEGEEEDAKREAFLGVKLFSEIYERFGGNYPEDDLFCNILSRNYGIKDRSSAIRIVKIIKGAASFLNGIETPLEEGPNQELPNKQFANPQTNPNMDPRISPSGKIFSIAISAPLGNFILEADNKNEFIKIKNEKLKKVLDTIEALWPDDKKTTTKNKKSPDNNHSGSRAETSNTNLSSSNV